MDKKKKINTNVVKNLSDIQSNIVESINEILLNKKKSQVKYIGLPSCAGSGKSTTLLGTLQKFFSHCELKKDFTGTNNLGEIEILVKGYSSQNLLEEVGDLSYINFSTQHKKALVLSFGRNTIDDFTKKADNLYVSSIVNEEMGILTKELKMSLLINASTYHSLLLKASKEIIEKLNYLPDYSKSRFYKKDISLVLDKLSINCHKDVISKFYNGIEKYHLSPLSYSDFIRKWNSIENNDPFSFAEAKLLKIVIKEIYKEMSSQTITMPHSFYYKAVYEKAKVDNDFLMNIFKDDKGISYEFILVDESQDSDEIIYNLIKKSGIRTIFVGDPFQNIYKFRGTYNVFNDLKKEENKKDTLFYYLNESFRYGVSIANLTSNIPKILNCKEFTESVGTKGLGGSDCVNPKPLNLNNIEKYLANTIKENSNAKKSKREIMSNIAIVTRSNKRAFEIYTELKRNEFISSEIKIESGLKTNIKEFINKGVNAISDIAFKEIICNKIGKDNASLDEMLENKEIVELLANSEYSFLIKMQDKDARNAILAKQTGYETMTIVTVHASKGLEYTNVILADDFIKNENESDILMIDDYELYGETSSKKEQKFNISDEEVNIIYTGATRAKKTLSFMEGNLFNMLKNEIENVSSLNNSMEVAKHLTYLIYADVIEIEDKKNIKITEKNEPVEKNIQNDLLNFI